MSAEQQHGLGQTDPRLYAIMPGRLVNLGVLQGTPS